MAVYGIGIDTVEIERIRLILDRDDGFAFRKRVFDNEESVYCEKSARSAEHYAARFAAKEAFIKAAHLEGLALNEICVRNRLNGEPYLVLSESINSRLKKNGANNTILTITHTRITASAVVLIEKND